jgi:hypothetical protein
VLTVGNDVGRVERMLEEGSLCCPDCGGRLAGWGHGRERVVFGLGAPEARDGAATPAAVHGVPGDAHAAACPAAAAPGG